MPPKTSTLRVVGGVLPTPQTSTGALDMVAAEARRAVHPVKAAWIPVSNIDEPPEELNSRRAYTEASINELAGSIREHGILQPLCVRPTGARYGLVFGVRRLRAAIVVGLQEVPCTIQVADDDRAFLLNTVENLHRQQLSGAERLRAIEKLAATGLSARDLSRRTGFHHATIARWLRIDRHPLLREALEREQLDLGRAMVLADAPPETMADLLAAAPTLRQPDLQARVAAARVSRKATASALSLSRLQAIVMELRQFRQVGPAERTILREIATLATRLVEESSDGVHEPGPGHA